MSWGLDAVRVCYGSRVALTSVTVPAAPAAVTVIVGGDGAGKSSALRCLVGLVEADQGVVRRPPKSQIGYVPATAGLYPDLTVRENLVFVATAYGMSGAPLEQSLTAVLDRVGLAEVPDRLGGQLSGGMQRKLAVAMALVHSPRLLVLDEPTTGVDPVSRGQLWRLIAGAAAGGAAVVVATTYVREAQRGTSAVLLQAGHVRACGPAADIVEHVPGALGASHSTAQPTPLSWRHGSEWRVWAPTGDLPPGTRTVSPNIEDAAVIAELAAEMSGGS